MEIETIEKFIPDAGIDECGTGRRDGLLIRYCRKKFKCIIIFMLLGIALCQTTAIIVRSIDLDELSNFSNTSHSIHSINGKVFDVILNKVLQADMLEVTNSNNTTTKLTNSTKHPPSTSGQNNSPAKIGS